MNRDNKRCSRCEEQKPLGEFYPDRRKSSGVSSQCKQCVIERSQERYYADPGKYRARNRARYKRRPPPEAKPCIRCEKLHARRSDFCSKTCADAFRGREWRHKNSRRRTRTRASDLTAADVKALLSSRTYCPCCRKRMTQHGPRQKHLDHIVPIAIGGTHTHGNVRVICAACNLARPFNGSDLHGHQPTLWAVDARAAQAAASLRAKRSMRVARPPSLTTRTAQLRRRLWTERAKAAVAARRLGLRWQEIADVLGYSSPGAAHNSIRLRLRIDPTSIFKPEKAA